MIVESERLATKRRVVVQTNKVEFLREMLKIEVYFRIVMHRNIPTLVIFLSKST